MYPFERFTELAKKTLTLAQQEAERSHHSYIGTEHVLLGVLRNEEGLGFRVLEVLGVEIDVVRQSIESVVGRNERTVIQQIIPTSRVKKVIELSFEEAQRMGHEYVGTEHLLLGLVLEGEGIAAHVLGDLGVTVAKVRHELERQLVGAPAESAHPAASATRTRSLRDLAGTPGTVEGSDLESLEALLAKTTIAQLLQAKGLDVDAAVGVLSNPPEEVVRLRRYVNDLRAEIAAMAETRNYEKAWHLQQGEKHLFERLAKAEQEWIDGLTSE